MGISTFERFKMAAGVLKQMEHVKDLERQVFTLTSR